MRRPVNKKTFAALCTSVYTTHTQNVYGSTRKYILIKQTKLTREELAELFYDELQCSLMNNETRQCELT